MIIILAGSMGRFPIGGNAWVNMQYLLGLRNFGHDVFFLEECGEGSWVYNWETEEITTDLDYPTAYVAECLWPIGFGDRWIYRAGDRSVGMSIDDFRSACSYADLLIFLGNPIDVWREEYNWPRRRIYIDLDPGFTHIRLVTGDSSLLQTVERSERLFTIGQRIAASDCMIPTAERQWLKTVTPVSLPHWFPDGNYSTTHFTSVMQWHSYKEVAYKGVKYGNKDKEFLKFTDLPKLTQQPFHLAITGDPPVDLARYGWKISTGWVASRTPELYRKFVRSSRAEFGVGKHGYVATRCGWFSDRSVCYLASGRPVLVQDTGLSDWLPTGEGLLTFRDVHEALSGIEIINADYERHCRAARILAERYFSVEVVLPPLIEAAMA